MLRTTMISAISCLALASPALAQEFTLRVHSFSSPASIDHTEHLGPWAETIERESDGRIQVEVYPAMQLGGKASDLITQLDDGVVDMIWTVPGFHPGRFTGVEGLELPFINTGLSETMTPAAMEFVTENLQDELEGIKLISIFATDAALIHSKTTPVRTLEDFDGLRLRVSGRFIGEAVSALGATPVGILLPEVYEALERNQVDGILTNWAITAPFRLYEVTKYHTDYPIYQIMLMTLMNQDFYDGLPEDLQAVIDANSGMEYAKKLAPVYDSVTEAARQLAVDAGNELVVPEDGEIARWKEAVQPAYQAWIEAMNERGHDGEALFEQLKQINAQAAQ